MLIGLCQLEADQHGRDEEDRAADATLGVRVDVNIDIGLIDAFAQDERLRHKEIRAVR